MVAMVSRRLALGGGLAVVAAGSAWRGAVGAEAVVPRDLAFDVLRKGTRIGANEVGFRSTDDGGLAVTTVMDVAVKVVFATVFSYRQEARDVWRDGRLVASDIDTVEDGKRSTVRLREAAPGGRIAVDGPSGAYEAEPGTMTDLCFWNEAVVRQARIVDGQTGELMPLTLKPAGLEALAVAGRQVPATRHSFGTTRGREGSVWYDEGGRWLRAEYLTRGETLVFEARV